MANAITSDEHPAPSNEIRIVLLGKTGSGKSKTGNSIIGDIHGFGYGSDARSVTSQCLLLSRERFGKKLDVVDTPGVFDTTRSNKDIQKEIKRCITMTTPGPHAILLCVKMTRFTNEDTEALDHFLRYFGDELLKYALVIFTSVDQWELDREELGGEGSLSKEEYIKNLPECLGEFLKSINNRYVFFNNRLKDQNLRDKQIKGLIYKIEEMVGRNNGSCYTNECYDKVEKLLQKEISDTHRNRDELKTDESFIDKIAAVISTIIKIAKKIIL